MATPDRGGGSGDDHADHADGAIICPWRTAEFYDQECSLFFDCPSHVVERALEDEAGPSRPGNSDNAGEESSRSAAEPPAPVTAGGAGGVGGAAAGAEVGSAAAAGNAGDWTAARLPHPREESPGEGNMSSVEPPEPRRRNPEEQDVEGEEDDDQPMTLGEFVRAFPSQAAAAGSSRSGHEQRTAVVSRPNRTNADGSSPLEVSGQASGGQQQQQQQQVRSATEALAQRDEAGESPRPRAPSHRLSAGTESQSPRQTLSATQPSPADARQPADDRRGPPPIVLPRWQPDAEVTYCPICHSQFSIFLRKHHCR